MLVDVPPGRGRRAEGLSPHQDGRRSRDDRPRLHAFAFRTKFNFAAHVGATRTLRRSARLVAHGLVRATLRTPPEGGARSPERCDEEMPHACSLRRASDEARRASARRLERTRSRASDILRRRSNVRSAPPPTAHRPGHTQRTVPANRPHEPAAPKTRTRRSRRWRKCRERRGDALEERVGIECSPAGEWRVAGWCSRYSLLASGLTMRVVAHRVGTRCGCASARDSKVSPAQVPATSLELRRRRPTTARSPRRIVTPVDPEPRPALQPTAEASSEVVLL